MAKVYISSTYIDLKVERQKVIDWLVSAGYQPVHSYTPNSDTIRDSCLNDVDMCDIYVLILGHRYGFPPKDDNPKKLSITHLEYLRAIAKGIPIIALLQRSIPNVALSDINNQDSLKRVQAFQKEVCKKVRPGEFLNHEELISALAAGIISSSTNKLDSPNILPDAARHLFNSASRDLLTWKFTLPGDLWLERPELDILNRRIEDNTHSITLLLGEPGCGKSALPVSYTHLTLPTSDLV